MSRVLLDTNAYTALIAGDALIAELLRSSDAVILSPVVLGELFEGFRSGSRYDENMAILGRFRAKPRTITVPITDETAEWFGTIKSSLRRRGRPIPINDVWIAASCFEHGAVLITRDAHFTQVEGLRIA